MLTADLVCEALTTKGQNVCRHINRHLTAHESILHNEGTAHKGELKRRGNPVTGKVSGVSVIVWGHDSSFQSSLRLPV